jgi:hypothetical protein
MVLEMTSVISVDSTAVHVIEDVVNDFRYRGVQVAFAMVGNRVEKTFRRAGLKRFVGEQWFFATVHEAVQYCLRHQYAKMTRKDRGGGESGEPTHALGVGDNPVIVGTEIGFSNDMHQGCTTIFISLAQDIPMIMSDITAVFRQNNITIIRAQIEPFGDNGAKHTYLLKSIKRGNQLTDFEIERVREELQAVLVKTRVRAGAQDSRALLGNDQMKLDIDTTERIKRLEDAVNLVEEGNQKLRQHLEAQSQRLSDEPCPPSPRGCRCLSLFL